MAAQQSAHLVQQQQQQQHWWQQSLHAVGESLRGMQHNLQHFADGVVNQHNQRNVVPQSTVLVAQRSLATHQPSAIAAAPASSGSTRHAAAAVQSGGSSSSSSSSSSSTNTHQRHQQPVTKEELGRATWTFLHTLAAQFPEHPTRQQQRDARQLIDSLTRIYPCADCAKHFQDLVRRDPPAVGSGQELSLWMCRTHNAVNRRLGKATFNCDLVAARWAPLDCDEHNSCDMAVGKRP